MAGEIKVGVEKKTIIPQRRKDLHRQAYLMFLRTSVGNECQSQDVTDLYPLLSTR